MKRHLTLAAALAVLLPLQSSGQERKAWDFLRELVVVPGVSGYEGRAADYIQGKLPAGLEVRRDSMHNVWFTAGSGSPHLLFVAHSDELGWVVSEVTVQGRLRVKPGGGLFPRVIEARPVVVHTAAGPVPGVVAPRKGYNERPQEGRTPPGFSAQDIEVVLGVRTEAEARALGVAEGDPVTPKKVLADLAPGVTATRAVDDRAGCAVLLDAVLRIDWRNLKGRTVTFAWDVQEETGLFGAAELAKTLKPDYVFAVDTFVSTDSPLESRRLAFLPLGGGAVIRAVDSSNITPKTEIRKVMELARRRRIPVQTATSRGGNDGSVFVPEGSVDIPLSWPGAYAHSLVEKVDRRDLEALADLIVAVVKDWK
jgi:putative aminopeptidase FrvX